MQPSNETHKETKIDALIKEEEEEKGKVQGKRTKEKAEKTMERRL